MKTIDISFITYSITAIVPFIVISGTNIKSLNPIAVIASLFIGCLICSIAYNKHSIASDGRERFDKHKEIQYQIFQFFVMIVVILCAHIG